MDCDIFLANVRVFFFFKNISEFPLKAAFSLTCFKEYYCSWITWPHTLCFYQDSTLWVLNDRAIILK